GAGVAGDDEGGGARRVDGDAALGRGEGVGRVGGGDALAARRLQGGGEAVLRAEIAGGGRVVSRHGGRVVARGEVDRGLVLRVDVAVGISGAHGEVVADRRRRRVGESGDRELREGDGVDFDRAL